MFHDSGVPLEARLRVSYTNNKDKDTERLIQVRRFDMAGYVYAYCSLKNKNRTFRIDRITLCIDDETGVIVHDPYAWLYEKYKTTDDFCVRQFIKENKNALRALNFVAKADGAMRAAERLAIKKFCLENGVHRLEVINLILEQVKKYGKETPQVYGKALHAMKACADDYKTTLYSAAQYMVNSDKTKRDAEFKALNRMIEVLGIEDILPKN